MVSSLITEEIKLSKEQSLPSKNYTLTDQILFTPPSPKTLRVLSAHKCANRVIVGRISRIKMKLNNVPEKCVTGSQATWAKSEEY